MEGESNGGIYKKGVRQRIEVFCKEEICYFCFVYKYKDDVDYSVKCYFIFWNL